MLQNTRHTGTPGSPSWGEEHPHSIGVHRWAEKLKGPAPSRSCAQRGTCDVASTRLDPRVPGKRSNAVLPLMGSTASCTPSGFSLLEAASRQENLLSTLPQRVGCAAPGPQGKPVWGRNLHEAMHGKGRCDSGTPAPSPRPPWIFLDTACCTNLKCPARLPAPLFQPHPLTSCVCAPGWSFSPCFPRFRYDRVG